MSHGLLSLRKWDFSCHTLEYENIMIQNNISQEMFAKFVVWNIGGNIFEQISNIFCQTIRGTVQNLFTNFLRRGGRYPIEFSFSVSFIFIILVLVIPFSEREVLNLTLSILHSHLGCIFRYFSFPGQCRAILSQGMLFFNTIPEHKCLAWGTCP